MPETAWMKYDRVVSEPRFALSKMGIRLPVPHGDVSRYTAFFVVMSVLIDNGLLDRNSTRAPSGALRGPSWWRFNISGMPGRVRTVLYRWLNAQWDGAIGIIMQSNDWMAHDLGFLSPRHCDLREVPLVELVRATVGVRDVLAQIAGLEPSPNNGPVYPALADFVFSLDQARDRLLDTIRHLVISRWVRDELGEEERAAAVAMLEMQAASGLWHGDLEADLAEFD